MRWWLPESLFMLAAIGAGWWLFADGSLDQRVAAAWFDPATRTWIGSDRTWVWFFYRFGPWVGIGAAIIAALLLIGMVRLPRLRPWWRPCVFTIGVMVVGAGLVVHEGFKPFFDRPRPRETTPFAVDGRAFQPPWTVAEAGTGKSFVSGHGASGFAVALGWLLLRRRRPWLAAGVLVVGLAWGGAIAAARMAVGGHWASDLWWSAIVVWTVGLALWYGLRIDAAAARREDALPAPASGP